MQWVSIYGNHVAVINGMASWAVNKQTGRYAEIRVDGKEAGGKITEKNFVK